MSFIGLQLPETIDILGRTLALNPVTLAVLIGLPLLWGLWLWYWFGSRPAASSQIHHTTYHPQEAALEPEPQYEPQYERNDNYRELEEPTSPIHYFDLSKRDDDMGEVAASQDDEGYSYEDRPDSDFYSVIQPALIPGQSSKVVDSDDGSNEPQTSVVDGPELKDPPEQALDRVSLN